MITLFVGDCTQDLSDSAKAHDPSAFLVDKHNWQDITQRSQTCRSITIYTSLADLPKIDGYQSALWDLMQVAKTIYYAPPATWSDQKDEFVWAKQKDLTEFYLWQCQRAGKRVIGIEKNRTKEHKFLSLTTERHGLAASIWIAGCSVSHGVGVASDQKYGALLEQQFDRPFYYLTMPGSSLEWQADQILRSDISSLDLVIWGLTQETRAPIAINGAVDAWPDDSIQDVDYRLHETRYYKAITSVYQVINFCQKIGCKLILLPLLCSEKLYLDLMTEKFFCHMPYRVGFKDRGTDGIHPGPAQHTEYAQICMEFIKTHK